MPWAQESLGSTGGVDRLSPLCYPSYRAVEAQVQPVVEVIQPGPWSNPQRWNVERRRKAQQSVELAIVTWKSKHGGSEPKQC